jgi:hypothetical protein
MIRGFKREIFVVTAVAVVAALASSSAFAHKGRNGQFGPRGGAMFSLKGGDFAAFVRGGPMRIHLGGRGFGVFGHHGRGHRGGPGSGSLLASDVLANAAAFLGMTPADLATALKGGKTLAQVAVDKGKTAAALITALNAGAKKNVDAAVAAGWITEAQATTLLERLADEVESLVNAGPPVVKARGAGPLAAAATYLGMTVADLRTALQGGKSLAQVATDKGKSVDGLVAALTADAKKKLDAAVAAGDITQAQANTLLSKLTAQVTEQVNRVPRVKSSASKTTTTALKTALTFSIRR